MKFSKFVVGVLALTVGFALTAHAATDSDKNGALVAQEIQKLLSSEAEVQKSIAESFGQLSPEKLKVAARNMKTVVGHKNFAGALAKSIEPLATLNASTEMMVSAGFESVALLQSRGMSRLPTERQTQFLTFMGEFVAAQDGATCKDILMGRVPDQEVSKLANKFLGKQPVAKFESVSTLFTDATVAELNDFPGAKRLTAEQAEMSDKVFAEAYVKKLMTKLKQEDLAQFSQDASRLTGEKLCFILSQTFLVADSMPEPYKGWQVTKMLTLK